jgi:formylmethanofuran dehydrogenase subunit C
VPQPGQDGIDPEVTFSRKDAIRVRGQLAGDAGKVANLNMGQVGRRQQVEILEFAWARIVMEQIQADSDVGFATLGDKGNRGVQAATETGGAAKLQRQTDAEARRPLGRLTKRHNRPLQGDAIYPLEKIGHQDEGRDAENLTQIESPLVMIEVGLALGPLRQQQPTLVGGRHQRHVPVREQLLGVGRGVVLQVGFQLGQPDLHGGAPAVGIAVDVVRECPRHGCRFTDARSHPIMLDGSFRDAMAKALFFPGDWEKRTHTMLRLRYLGSRFPLSLEGLTPDRLAGQDVAAISSLRVWCGNAEAPLADFFAISGDAGDQDILLEASSGQLTSVGARMVSGRLTVHGHVGPHAGAGMSGGELHIQGDAGNWLGAEMRGGRIAVHGNAGHQVGSVYPGGQVGMRGGVLLVDGNVGEEIGCNLRRGLLAIGGSCADFAGCGMIAGTILVFGAVGMRPGAGMKRGTLLCAAEAPPLLPTFRFDCTYRPVFLTLYFNQLRAWGFHVPESVYQATWQRFSGDLLALGKGEFLVPRT